MPMLDWVITNYVDPEVGGGIWVYRRSSTFPEIHLSQCVDDRTRDHMATDDRRHYYFGVTATYSNANTPQYIRDELLRAWNDYFTTQ